MGGEGSAPIFPHQARRTFFLVHSRVSICNRGRSHRTVKYESALFPLFDFIHWEAVRKFESSFARESFSPPSVRFWPKKSYDLTSSRFFFISDLSLFGNERFFFYSERRPGEINFLA